MAWVGTTRARAKINLTLHIRGRLDNGYHDLESLVAFADLGDDVTLVAGERLSLTISGPEAKGLAATSENHILKAAEALRALKPDLRMGHFHLLKRLPIASGMGGGSADAAAALRLLVKLNGLHLDDPRVIEAARHTGADVPVCLQSQARMMRGIGDALDQPYALPSLFAVLVNPRMTTPTPDVFKAIGLRLGEQRPSSQHEAFTGFRAAGDVVHYLARHGNDMEAAAISLVPHITTVKAALQSTMPALVRMSGSGATLFALHADCRAAAHAAKTIRLTHPDWWVKATVIGSV
jgi:4-diphosphocytidyl-2-C-methyl-D-erythritol kinase